MKLGDPNKGSIANMLAGWILVGVIVFLLMATYVIYETIVLPQINRALELP